MKTEFNVKSTSNFTTAQENLHIRNCVHNERLLFIIEWYEWLKVIFRFSKIAVFLIASLHFIFRKSKVDKFIEALTSTNQNAWQLQIIYGFVIIFYFISKIFKKDSK